MKAIHTTPASMIAMIVGHMGCIHPILERAPVILTAMKMMTTTTMTMTTTIVDLTWAKLIATSA